MNSSELEKITYIIYRPFDFSCSQKQLTYIYAPIVGSGAIGFYQWLINEFNVQTTLKGIKSPLSRIFHCLGCTQSEFAEMRSQLEAINLITTHTQITATDKIMHISVNEPLNWKRFNSNQKFKHLLINKIGISEYERISLAFTNRRIPNDTVNISASFEAVFGSENINGIMEFNFQSLHELLSADFKQPVVLTENVKIIIETYFKSHNLSVNEIKKCVYQAAYREKNGTFMIDENLLLENFQNLTAAAVNLEMNDNIEIYRNPTIFYELIDDQNEINHIFNDYRNFNAERYLASIQKEALDLDQKKTISYLRKSSHLTDSVINLLTDFMIYRTNGKYSVKYLKKLATTVNRLGLTHLDKILNYLRSVCEGLKNKRYSTDEYISFEQQTPTQITYTKKADSNKTSSSTIDDDEFDWSTVEVL
ncbi:hypothetical protein [[Mycoplasma] testudinis]|uniref:hypothetical protein n=1 Tax=[Mycoplasma] testudinis TaxID=33924 RepID=UPI000480635E|nr:hypothetical protein [[Mycoplasma] testudinis]